MIVDFADPTVEDHLVADVCVVGSGPAGLAVARELLRAGTSVLVVESGGDSSDGAAKELSRGESVGVGLDLEAGRARAFGGTGTVWPGQCIRLDASDLAVRDWVPDSGWPVSAADLDAYYTRAEAWLGISAQASDEQAWRRFGLVPPAVDPDRLAHKSAVYSPHPDVGALYRPEFEAADGARVLLNATAAGIRTGADGAAEELEIRSLSGRVGRVRAAAFVLCGGGIENARLLLLSGLGNEHDTVGRYFQEHPTIWADVASDRPDQLQEFYGYLGRGRVRYVPRVRLGWPTQRDQQVLNAVATFVFDERATPGLAAAQELSSALQARRRPQLSGAQLRGAVRELGGVARAGLRRFVRGRPTAGAVDRIRLKMLMEQAPDPRSRITLSDECDELGLPRARVDWRLSELERRTTRVFLDTLDGELRRLGLGRITGTEWLDDDDWTAGFEDAYHPMGSTRMSADPTRGVVDPDCRVHGVEGLYVCGSSVFPAGGYANPTLTIVAMALRLADHLRNRTR